MKKIITITLTTLAFCSFAFYSCNKIENVSKDSNSGTKPHSSIRTGSTEMEFLIIITRGIEVVLPEGTIPCAGSGPMCSVRIEPIFPDNPYVYHEEECGGIIKKLDDDRIQIKYIKSTMPSDMHDWFLNGRFTMPQDRTLPRDICLMIGLKAEQTIVQGEYAYTEDNDYYSVTF
jgi:hypothetical protein